MIGTDRNILVPTVIDIVLPVHNEGSSIAQTLREFHQKVSVEDGIPVRFVICEDGSSDDTVPVLQALAGELPIKLISDPVRKGYSRAVIDGLRATDSDWVLCIDSDGQCDPSDLVKLAAARPGHDMIIGYRNPRSDTPMRKAMSGAFGIVYRRFFNVRLRDPSCPYVFINRAGLNAILSGKVGIQFNSSAARVKLKWRAEASKACSAAREGRRERVTVMRFPHDVLPKYDLQPL